jgi:(p)ppGpp synthase/HD superfamily hydrolase
VRPAAGEHVVAVAFLHDVVEDTAATLDDLRALNFPERVVEAVDALTRREGETPDDYYVRVRANRDALAVKLMDVRDNADPRRLALLDIDTRKRLQWKYAKALLILTRP